MEFIAIWVVNVFYVQPLHKIARIGVIHYDIDRTARCNRSDIFGFECTKKSYRSPLHRISLAVLKMSVYGYSNISST